jgi:hypothetical protein
MLYLDFDWDVSPGGIKFDKELNIDRLGWKHGDCFKITNINGQAMLVKMEAVEQFSKGMKVNGSS